MKFIFTIHLITLLLLLAQNTNAKTIYYVTQNGTGNGTSWATASGDIQSMIDKSVAGDEVWVAKGTYYPTAETIARDARSRTFLIKEGVVLTGGYTGTETSINQRALSDLDADGKVDPFEFLNTTLLSGDIDGVTDVWTKKIEIGGIIWNWIVTGNENNCYSVVTGKTDSSIDGFSVIGSNGDLNNKLSDAGGGIFSSSSVKNCIVTNCSAKIGGGINATTIINCLIRNCSASDYGGGISSSSVTNSTVRNCSAYSGGGIISNFVNDCVVSDCSVFEYGGGIYSTFSVTNTTVSDCSASREGGGIYFSNYFSSFFITKCTIDNCSAALNGGGIYYNSLSSSIANCTVSNCSVYSGSGSVYSVYDSTGGGICSKSPSGSDKISYCSVSNCSATTKGGGIFSHNKVMNSVISNCSATSGGGIYSPDVRNCLVSNCSATIGGGIYTLNLISSSVFNCSATTKGGGVFSDSAVNSSAISNCSAPSGGGVYSVNSVTNCEVSNNGSSNIVGENQVLVSSHDIYKTYINPMSFIGNALTNNQKTELLLANWQLCEGSPCINAGGANLNSGISDIAENPRVRYEKMDIGAYEYKVPTISLPVIEDFNNVSDIKNCSILYKSNNLNTEGSFKWVIENNKAVFSWKVNLTNYNEESFFTYEIDATKASTVFLKYWMYFEAYPGLTSPLGTEKLNVQYSVDCNNWIPIVSYSNQNGTIPNKAYLHDISTKVAGKTFFIRFNANGENTNRIEKWELDNIIVDTDGQTTDVNLVREETIKCYIREGILNVENSGNYEKVQVFDIKGVLVANNKSINSAIKISLPSRGVYLVKAFSNNGIEAAKVIW